MPFPQNGQILFYSTVGNSDFDKPAESHVIDNVPLSLVHRYRGESTYNHAIWFFVKMKITENIASRSFGHL